MTWKKVVCWCAFVHVCSFLFSMSSKSSISADASTSWDIFGSHGMALRHKSARKGRAEWTDWKRRFGTGPYWNSIESSRLPTNQDRLWMFNNFDGVPPLAQAWWIRNEMKKLHITFIWSHAWLFFLATSFSIKTKVKYTQGQIGFRA